MTDQILKNIRILDFSWVLAGPYATRLLADFGAEVIKIEKPGGDPARFRGPFYKDQADPEKNLTWFAFNANKKGITLDIEAPKGKELFKKLVKTADAVLESFPRGYLDSLDLGYKGISKVKPDIIMVSLSVMGQTGPWRDYVGFGPTVQAFSGLTGLTSFPGRPPTGLGFAYADHIAGLYASLALLGALEQRRRTGEGQFIDISQVEAVMGLLGGTPPEAAPMGNRSPWATPHQVYRCRDGRWCAVAVFTDEAWRAFKKAMGRPPWAEGEKFATLSGRLENAEALDGFVEAWTQQHTAAEVMSRLQESGVAAGVVQDAGDLFRDPQLGARGFFVELDGTMTDASPIRLARAPAEYRRAAPGPGQDNGYVYGQLLGLSEGELAGLRERGVI